MKTLKLLALSFILVATPGASKTLVAKNSYSLGVVPQYDVRRIQQIWSPILEKIRNDTGIDIRLGASPDIPAFEKQFTAGDFDFAYMNPYHLLEANKQQGYLPVVRDNGRKLYGVIVVRKDSPIRTVADLAGQTVAFPAPNALGAALIPRAEFSNKFKIDISPRYVKNHTSVYLNVLLGQAAAGGGVQKTFDQQRSDVKDQLRVLYKTAQVAPHPLAVHPRVPPEITAAVKKSLLDMGMSLDGQAMLRKVPVKKIGEAHLEDYHPLKTMGLDAFYVH